MNRMIAVSLTMSVRSIFNEIISTQIDGIRKRKTVDLSLNTDTTAEDSPLVAEIKKQLKYKKLHQSKITRRKHY